MLVVDQSLLKCLEEPFWSPEVERSLWNQAKVHTSSSKAGIGSDEASVASHQFDDANAILSAFRFNVGAFDDLCCDLDGRFDRMFFQ